MREKVGRTALVLLITVSGSVLLVLGVVMIFIPGPGMLITFLGLAILAKQFSWPRRLLDWLKSRSTGLVK